MKRIAREVRAIHKSALSGEYWAAMTINGILYSTVLGFDPSIALEALSAGAMAAGLSGTGPAVAAVVPKDNVEGVRDAWQRHRGKDRGVNWNSHSSTFEGSYS